MLSHPSYYYSILYKQFLKAGPFALSKLEFVPCPVIKADQHITDTVSMRS